MLAGGSVELHARQERIVEAITATGAELVLRLTVEVQGSDKPACVAETMSIVYGT